MQISYEVERDGIRERRELPFVIGVLGNFSGKAEPPPPRLRDRKFVQIEAGNFDAAMAHMRPRLALHVENRLRADGSKLAVELRFAHVDDFEPEAVARQVAPLRKLAELRGELSGMLRQLHDRRGPRPAAARTEP